VEATTGAFLTVVGKTRGVELLIITGCLLLTSEKVSLKLMDEAMTDDFSVVVLVFDDACGCGGAGSGSRRGADVVVVGAFLTGTSVVGRARCSAGTCCYEK
jgi:hypothetical protein